VARENVREEKQASKAATEFDYPEVSTKAAATVSEAHAAADK